MRVPAGGDFGSGDIERSWCRLARALEVSRRRADAMVVYLPHVNACSSLPYLGQYVP